MKSKLSLARGACAAVEYEGALYVAGGIVSDGSCTNTVEVFDPTTTSEDTPHFATAPSLKTPRGLFDLIVHGGELLAIGSDEVGVVEKLDKSKKYWRDAFYIPNYTLGSCAVSVNDDIYFFGLQSEGQGTKHERSRWDCFMSSKQTWKSRSNNTIKKKDSNNTFLLPRRMTMGKAVVVPAFSVKW
jgi:hypothetical protein